MIQAKPPKQKVCTKCSETKKLEEYRPKRGECKKCQDDKRMVRYWANRDAELAAMKARNPAMYQRRAEVIKERSAAWAKANPDKRRDICKENQRRQRVDLSNAYVRRMLAQSIGLPATQIPEFLVTVQRELIKLKRAINEKL